MAKTNVSTLSAARIVVETQPDGTTAAMEGASSFGAVAASSLTVSGTSALTGALSLGTGNAVTAAAAVASTNKVAITVNGTVYYFLVTTVA